MKLRHQKIINPKQLWHKTTHSKKIIFVMVAFFILGLIGILNHAMWRDELNGWLIARDSANFSEFIDNIKYEGHPILWYGFLALLNQITHNPLAMQIFHLVIATGCAGIFLCFSPFTFLQKTLFVFGYLPLYEYLVISRNYSLGFLFVLLTCTLWNTRKKTYIFVAITLALMANSNAYCLLIAVALAITLGIEYLFQDKLKITLKANFLNIFISLTIVIIGIVGSVYLLLPPLDSTLQGGASQWFFEFDFHRLLQTLSRIWSSYILILVPKDSSIMDGLIFAILSLGILGLLITSLIKKPIPLIFYLTATGEILLFTYLKFLGSQRHYGHLYIILIVSLWLATYYPSSNLVINQFKKYTQFDLIQFNQWRNWLKIHQSKIIFTILFCQLVAGIISFSRDLTVPYSASRETANFLKTQSLQQEFLMGSEDFTIAPISGYLNQKIYYPESQKLGSFVLFNSKRNIVNDEEILRQATNILEQKENSVLLILNHSLETSNQQLNISFIKSFTNAFIYNEKYYLYSVSLK